MLSFGPHTRGLLVEGKHGVFVVDPEDGFVSAWLLKTGVYNEQELMLARSFVSQDGNVLIVGAHIGAHAVPLSRSCKKMVAIEANPDTFNYLKANFLMNKCGNVSAFHVAASDKFEKIQFVLSRDNSGGSKRMPVHLDPVYFYDNPGVVDVDAHPLDSFVDPKSFDLIIMDIEGSEYFAFKGMPEILAASKVLMVKFVPHLLRNVANIDVDVFLEPLLPYFGWMHVPRDNSLYPRDEIANRMRAMYQADDGHEGLVFLKVPPATAAAPSGIDNRR